MSKNLTQRFWLMLASIILMGIGVAQAQTSFPAGIETTTRVSPTENGYVLIKFDQVVDMTGQYCVFYTYSTSFGAADETVTAIESNGTPAGQVDITMYGSYMQYTGLTEVLYEVEGGHNYCVWNTPASGTITFSTTKPTLSPVEGGGGNTGANVIYICTNSYPDPANPMVVELGADNRYNFNLGKAQRMRMSTTKSDVSGDWSGFEVGEFNINGDDESPLSRVVTETNIENMKASPGKYYLKLYTHQNGWLYFSWEGDYSGYIFADSGSMYGNQYGMVLTTTTAAPELDYPILNPASGTTGPYNGTTITLAKTGEVSVNPAFNSQITLTNPAGGEPLTVENGGLEVWLDGIGGGFGGGSALIGIMVALDEETDYIVNPNNYPVQLTLTIPAGAILVDDVPYEAITATYTIPAGEGQETPDVDFNDFVLTPMPGQSTNWELAEPFTGATFTWDYPVEVLDASQVYVTDPAWGENFTTANGGITVKAEGNSLVIDMAQPLQLASYQQYFSVGFNSGAISVGGVTFEGNIDHQYTLAASGFSSPEPTTEPKKGSAVTSLSEITISWNGLWIDNDCLAAAKDAIKLMIGDKAWFPYYNGDPNEWQSVAIRNIVGNDGKNGGSNYWNSITIQLDKAYDNQAQQYDLYIPADAIKFMTKAEEADVALNEDVVLAYTITDYMTIPAQYETVEYKNFKGLQVFGNDLTVADASMVKLYASWDEITTASVPMATGVLATDANASEILITFPGVEMFDGTYTIQIPNGAITNLPARNIQFVITGHARSIDDIDMHVTPADGQTVEAIDNIKIYWGDYTQLTLVNETVNGKLAINGVSRDIQFELVKTQTPDGSDDGTGGGIDGQYDYYLSYTPAMPFTEPGNYVVTIPANQVMVYINQSNQPLNKEITLNYTIEGEPSLLPTPVVKVLPSQVDWFDAFSVVWWKQNNVPYNLSLINPGLITVTKNGVEDLDINVSLTEFQEDEYTPNYPTAQLVITLPMLEADPGAVYTLNVPAGAVNVDVDGESVPCNDVTYSFTLRSSQQVEVPAPTVNPAGPDVTALDVVTISWNGFAVKRNLKDGALDETDYAQPITLSINGGQPQEIAVGMNGESVEFGGYYKEALLKVDAAVDGEYLIHIPAGCFSVVSGATGTKLIDEDIDLVYNVTLNDQPATSWMRQAAVVLPENGDGEAFTSLLQFIISWNFQGIRPTEKGLSATVSRNLEYLGTLDARKFHVANVTTEPGSEGAPVDPAPEGYGNEIRVDVEDYIPFFNPVPGMYQVTIPEGIVENVNGALNPQQTFTFWIFPAIDVMPVSDPAAVDGENPANYAPLASLDKVKVTWPDYPVVELAMNPEVKLLVTELDENNDQVENYITLNPTVEDGSLVVNLGDYTKEDGSYTLLINEISVFFADDYTNGPAEFVYIVNKDSGVATIIGAVDGRFVVYNLNGVMILDTDNGADLNSLENGIYVINGKKVMIRK